MIQRMRTSGTRRDILIDLKTAGPSDAAALAGRLGVTAMAVRQHLYALRAERLVLARKQPRPLGRPAKLWQLTAEADRYFPDAHADLAVGLIETMRRTLGEDGLAAIIAARSDNHKRDYRAALDTVPGLPGKLAALAEIRTREGYMAAVTNDAEGYLFVENHCPICSAAKACTGLCAMELQVFQAALGDGCRIERTDHILAGARRCAYRVTPAE